MIASQRITLRQSECRQRLGEISALDGDAYTDEVRNEELALQKELPMLETRLRSALLAEQAEPPVEEITPDSEQREKEEIRNRAKLSNYFIAFSRGQAVSGAEAELAASEGVAGDIPFCLFEEPEKRAVTPAPSTVGVNLQSVLPAVFADSVAPFLGVSMPQVGTGTYATPVITTSLTAAAQSKGGNASADAATITVKSTTPKRVSARLELAIEDIASVGTGNFESALRNNLTMALSSQLDNYLLNGTGSAPQPQGLFPALGNAPSAPGSVANFDSFAGVAADLVDGVWARVLGEIGLLVGPATYALAAKTFQSASNYKGEMSAANYALNTLLSFATTSRIAAPASTIQQALAVRRGKPVTPATMPTWGGLSIDDMYSDSAAGQRNFTVHALVGDVLVHYPDAYRRISFKVS